MLNPTQFREVFAKAVPYSGYLELCKPHERAGWDAATARVQLRPEHIEVVKSFERRLNVLCISGTWCGDCVQQCPIFNRMALAHPADAGRADSAGIDLRFLERDTNLDVADHFKICGGHRVPVVIFLNEDFDFVGVYGDRTATRYRSLVKKHVGASCPTPWAVEPADETEGVIVDWLREFERAACLLRLSGKLRQKHGD